MPSIEIICVGQKSPSALPELPFAVESGTDLRSHRSPEPLWQTDFDGFSGCIYHLGNPSLRDDRCGRIFFAYYLLSERSRHDELGLLKFDTPFRDGVVHLLRSLIDASPNRQLVFTSDWQFGPDSSRGRFSTVEDFWHAHDRGQLRLNALYVIGVY